MSNHIEYTDQINCEDQEKLYPSPTKCPVSDISIDFKCFKEPNRNISVEAEVMGNNKLNEDNSIGTENIVSDQINATISATEYANQVVEEVGIDLIGTKNTVGDQINATSSTTEYANQVVEEVDGNDIIVKKNTVDDQVNITSPAPEYENQDEEVDDFENVEDKIHRGSIQNDLQTIQSQQQRLQREAQFSVPYHKPKKYTLQEFLNRRTIIKPFQCNEDIYSSPAVKSKKLKMSSEELEAYSKLMEDREKEASEFFKAEIKDDLNEATDKQHTSTLAKDDKREVSEKNLPNVIITEVVELPTLNLKDGDLNLKMIVNQSVLSNEKVVNQSVLPTEEKTSLWDSNSHTCATLKDSRTLKESTNITFDLATSNKQETSKHISRANSLLQRLLKMNPCPKSKEAIKSLTDEYNSKTLNSDAEPFLGRKPGETYLKLKDNLKSIIMKKRKEEMKKRQEEQDKGNKDLFDDTNIDHSNELECDDKLSPISSENSSSNENSDSESENELGNVPYNETDSIALSSICKENENKNEKPNSEPFPEFDLDTNAESKNSDDSQPLDISKVSQIPTTQRCNEEDETEQLIGLCSGTFETQIVQPFEGAIISSNEEISPNTNSIKLRKKKFTKKIKKNKMRLGFSDDEIDESDGDADSDVSPNMDDAPATYIDYDSEENEITVEMTKNDCLKHAEAFFEKEAQLSESEWGSADEDEKNLDQYDIELGDEDEFNREEIRSELEKIHARKMLDEDIREVKKLQEIFFEDDDNSAKRQRKFKWKNFETPFHIDINASQLNESKPGEGSDDDNEHLWRKIRFEREQTIKNNSVHTISMESATSIFSPGLPNKGASDIKNIRIKTVSKSQMKQSEEKEKSPFLISKELIKSECAKARSSFLLRNSKALSKAMCCTKNGNVNDISTSPNKVGVKTINPSKFVFTTLTFEEHESLKRKADDSKENTDIKIIKKSKTDTKTEFLIDKLL